MKHFLIIIFSFLFSIPSFAQNLFTNTNFKEALKKGTRTESGLPGKNYWQNRADYKMQIQFEPVTQLLQGKQTILYRNNSPDSLSQIIFRLYSDFYKRGIPRLSEVEEKDLTDGVEILSLQIGEEKIDDFKNPSKAFHLNTNLIVKPSQALIPGSITTIQVEWQYKVNRGSPVRTGMVDSTSYFIAYFFPRIAVYDDLDGWDTWSYNGLQEFYNDFGDFEVEIQVPKDYVVWATGERLDEQLNFSDPVMQKIKKASNSDSIIRVISAEDYAKNNVLNDGNTGLWKFHARYVSDFAFALSNHYLWEVSSVMVDSTTRRRSLAESAFNRTHEDYYDVADQAQKSLYYMSHYYPKYPFPYPKITVFDGTDQMEYPMMANDNPSESRKDAVQLTTHEIFHSYFPFFMGTNETQYAWMDEGWATIGESIISPLMGEPEDEGIYSKGRYEVISGTDRDVPLITNTKQYQGEPYRANSYGKAGLAYYVLQDMLGDDLFFKSLHHYMDTWNGKHPVPYDYFYAINAGSGKNLNWFWKKWFFGWEYPDLVLNKVSATKSGTTTIKVVNAGGLPVPIVVTIQLKNGKSIVVKRTAEIWKSGNASINIQINQPFISIASIVIGNEFIPEKNRKDNEWHASK